MRSVLENLLLQSRVIDAKRLRRANDVVLETECTLAHALVKLGLVSDRALAKLLSQTLNLRIVDPTRLDIHASALATLAGPRAYQLRVIPVRIRATPQGDFIYVAMSDPTDHTAVREIEASTGREVVPAVAEEKLLEQALRAHYAAEVLAQPRGDQLASTLPSDPVVDEPPVILGQVMSGEFDALGARLQDDGEYFTESTEELVTVYSRAMMKAGVDPDDADLSWLAERQALAEGPAANAMKRRTEASVAPSPHAPEPGDERTTETAFTPAMRRATRGAPPISAPVAAVPEPEAADIVSSVRPPTCVVVGNARLRAWMRHKLQGRVDRLHMEESIEVARQIGQRLPMGFVVIIQPAAEPTVSRKLQSLKELAGSPKVIVIGGERAFEVVPGVDAWADLPDPPSDLPDLIVSMVKRFQKGA